MSRYTQSLFTQLSQSVACNRLHSIEQRCARWLLMTADRMSSSKFYLTQEFLAQMLGMRRAGVNVVLRQFQKKKMVEYHLGNMKILDRKKLEGTTCECYNIVRDEYRRLTGAAG